MTATIPRRTIFQWLAATVALLLAGRPRRLQDAAFSAGALRELDEVANLQMELSLTRDSGSRYHHKNDCRGWTERWTVRNWNGVEELIAAGRKDGSPMSSDDASNLRGYFGEQHEWPITLSRDLGGCDCYNSKPKAYVVAEVARFNAMCKAQGITVEAKISRTALEPERPFVFLWDTSPDGKQCVCQRFPGKYDDDPELDVWMQDILAKHLAKEPWERPTRPTRWAREAA